MYRKPIVFDEVKYEGNIDQRWGQLTAEEMVHRFWQGTIAGTYVGHGETYMDPQDVIWWSKGGVLHGQSPARIEFLRKVLESGPPEGLEPIDKWQDPHIAGKAGEYYLIYFGKERPTQWIFELPRNKIANGAGFRVEILDTWNMTITPVEGVFKTTGRQSLCRSCRGRSVGETARQTIHGTSHPSRRLKKDVFMQEPITCRFGLLLMAIAAVSTSAVIATDSLPAFPGAEGFGSTTPGGRGGKV